MADVVFKSVNVRDRGEAQGRLRTVYITASSVEQAQRSRRRDVMRVLDL